MPTRARNHNGYLLRWDGDTLLVDPGEGTQRQMLHAGVSAASVDRICLTHAHGDHTLGLPGVLARRALDGRRDPAVLHYPAASREHVLVLLRAGAPAAAGQVVDGGLAPDPGEELTAGQGAGDPPAWRLVTRALDHRVPALGYRLQEPDGHRLLPERLRAHGLTGPVVGRLVREGRVELHADGEDGVDGVHPAHGVPDGRQQGRVVTLADVAVPRPGQAVAFVLDTRPCPAADELAAGVDLLVCESTFLSRDAALAQDYGHMTARQAGELAARAGVRTLVLTHFSQRYGDDGEQFAREAREVFDGDVVAAEDLDEIPVPPRERDQSGRSPATS